MADTGSGAGAANDATISTTGPVPASDADLKALRQNVENATAKVEKMQGHLDGAKESLSDAKAELAAAEKGN